MKIIWKSLVVLGLAVSLAGCSSKGKSSGQTSATKPDSKPTSTQTPAKEPTVLEAESSDDSVFGTIEDVFRTVFFDFRVDAVSSVDSYEDIIAEDDEQILVVDLSLANQNDEDIEMYDTDFIILCLDENGDVVEDTGFFPVTADEYEGDADMLAADYTLGANKKLSGKLVYRVPAEFNDFSFAYREEFADGETGACFYADFYFDD